MTTKDAIRIFTFFRETAYLKETKEAADMAIEALKREQQLLEAGYQNATVDFYIGGRLFRAKEIAQ